ncbi:hypothetical protein [Oscillatoria nigro-viridis]
MLHWRKFFTNAGLVLAYLLLNDSQESNSMRTEAFKVLQTFGLEYPNYKMLIQAKSGNRYVVLYSDSLGVEVGQEILIDFNDYNDWQTIDNPKNGRKSNISKVSKVN